MEGLELKGHEAVRAEDSEKNSINPPHTKFEERLLGSWPSSRCSEYNDKAAKPCPMELSLQTIKQITNRIMLDCIGAIEKHQRAEE